MTAQLAGMHVSLFGLQARETRDGKAEIQITVGVNSVQHLQEVTARLMRIDGVESVERSGV